MKKHKRLAVLFCMMACLLSGCGSSSAPEDGEDTSAEANVEQQELPTEDEGQLQEIVPDNEDIEPQNTEEDTYQEEHILIAYFTWADNTHVENPESVDVDATTSASVLPPGNVGLIADWIHQEIGGDVFSIQVEDLYSSDYDECLERASEENAANARPALATHVENMDQYDTVYLGYPNWWYSCPMALLSFLEEYDLSGKHIVLFCSHGTGGLSGSVEEIKAVLPKDCTVEENVLGVYRPEVADSQDTVLEWLQEVR